MKNHYRSFLIVLLLFSAVNLFAQDKKTEAEALIRQGTALHDAKKYDEAIAKYDEALKIDPDNAGAMFEKGFSLAASGKTDLAIPILEKVAATNQVASAYDVLGSIYDDKQDFDKAMKCYTQGIAAFPKYQKLWYNICISYYRQKKYKQAEDAAIEAIKLNPKHASSHRAYAMVTFQEGKHENSLLAWCSFLMMEPQTQRSAEACNYIKYILYHNIKGNSITIGNAGDQSNAQQMAISIGVTGSLAIQKAIDEKSNTKATAIDSLTIPLTSIFKLTAETKDKADSPFFSKYFADYFGALANTDYMSTFTHYITLSIYKDEDIAWIKSHEDKIRGLTTWVNTTKRDVE